MTLDVNMIRHMLIFTHEYRYNTTLERRINWLICNALPQHVGIDCMETFSMIVKSKTIQIDLSIYISKIGIYIN